MQPGEKEFWVQLSSREAESRVRALDCLGALRKFFEREVVVFGRCWIPEGTEIQIGTVPGEEPEWVIDDLEYLQSVLEDSRFKNARGVMVTGMLPPVPV